MSEEARYKSNTAEASLSEEDMNDYKMFTEYTIRFWKNKAFRMEQAKKLEETAKNIAETELARIRIIPQNILDSLITTHREKQALEVERQRQSLDKAISNSKNSSRKRNTILYSSDSDRSGSDSDS
jgi:hypothetical protein